jgi:DME family drug/metabolite transporter
MGVLLAFGAGCAMATYNVAAKQLMESGSALLDVLTGTFLLGGTLLIPLLVVQPLGWLVTADGILIAVYLGAATMALANTFMAIGLKRLRPGPVTTLTLADPLTATFLGFIVLGENLSIPSQLGLVLVALGLLLQGAASAKRRAPEVGALLATD